MVLRVLRPLILLVALSGAVDAVGADAATAPPALGGATATALDNAASAADQRREEQRRQTSEWLRTHLPRSLEGKSFLGLPLWSWVFLLGMFAIGLILSLAIRFATSRIIRRFIRQDGAVPELASVRRAAKPFGLAAAALLWHAALHVSGLEGIVLDVLASALRLFGVAMAAWAAFRVADFVAAGLAVRAARTESRLDDLLVPIVRKTIKAGAIVVAFLAALQSLGLAIAPLVASVGLGGFAVAFAAKDTIENFFGSLAVIVDRPFEVGDTISVAGIVGEVQEVGFRSTRLRASSGSIISLPNATLVRATVEKLAPLRGRSSSLTLRVDPHAPADDLAAACEDMRALLRSHPRVLGKDSLARLIGVGESSLELLVQAPLDVGTRAEELEAREQLLLGCLRALEARGIRPSAPAQSDLGPGAGSC